MWLHVSKVDGRALLSILVKIDDESQNQKSSIVAKLPPGGGQVVDIKILRVLAIHLWKKIISNFGFRLLMHYFY